MKKLIMGLLLVGCVFAVETDIEQACRDFVEINEMCAIEPKRANINCEALIGLMELHVKNDILADPLLKDTPEYPLMVKYANLVLEWCYKSCQMSIGEFYSVKRRMYLNCVRTRIWGILD